MTDIPNFKKIALANAKLGFQVVPLEDKSPELTLGAGWQNQASSEPGVIEAWAERWPGANCGVVQNPPEYWVLDVDHLPWFMENCPCPPQTYAVRTGVKSGDEWKGGELWNTRGRHYYFKGPVPVGVAKRYKNPKAPKEGEKNGQPHNLMEVPRQVVAAGSRHMKSGVLYEAFEKWPLSEPSPEFVSWLRRMSSGGGKAISSTFRKVKEGWQPEAELAKAGLKFSAAKKANLTYLNYHAQMKSCLECGRQHDGHAGLNEQSAFVWDADARQLFHYCHVAGASSAKGPLAALGVKFEDIFERPDGSFRARIASSRMSQVEDKATEWVPGLEGRIPRGMNSVTFAPKGRGKTKVCDWMTARVTAQGKRVVRYNLEDPAAQVLKPSLFKAGADLELVELVERDAFVSKDGKEMTSSIDFSKAEFKEAMVEHINSLGDVALVIVEPINNYKGKSKAVSEDDMRPLHNNFAEVAERTNVGMHLVNHANRKKETTDPLERSHGAGSGQNVARVNYFLDRDPDDKKKVKWMDAGSNLQLARNLVFEIVNNDDFELGGVVHKKIGHAVLVGETDDTAQEMTERTESTRQSDSRAIAEWIEDTLKKCEGNETEASAVQSQAAKENEKWNPDRVRQVFKRRMVAQKKAYSRQDGKKTFWGLGEAPAKDKQQTFEEDLVARKTEKTEKKEKKNDDPGF